MSTGNTSLGELARDIFSDLGYTITGTGNEFHAIRRWRDVTVMAVNDEFEAPSNGTYWCFVTWNEAVDTIEELLTQSNPGYEWAVIGVAKNGEYEVTHTPTA